MKFRDRARLDTSQVQDVRGRGGLGGMGRGGRVAVGGGGLGVVGLIVTLLLVFTGGGGLGDLGALSGETVGAQGAPSNSDLAAECQTGADANASEECRIVAVVNSVQQYWSGEFERQSWGTYRAIRHRVLLGRRQHGMRCGIVRGRPVLLPRRPARLHRPRILR